MLRRVAVRAGLGLMVLYLAVVAAAFAFQRDLLYLPPHPGKDPGPALPLVPGAPVTLAWFPAAPGKPTVVHFHGNNEELASLVDRAPRFTARGLGFAAIEYPGYGLSPGSPDERSILAAARLGLGYLKAHGVDDASLVLSGQSLGSGVALALAEEGHGARVVVLSPYTALPDVGARQYPFLPVQLLMQDRFASLERAPRVKQPVLVVHGTADALIPIEQGQAVAAALPHAVALWVSGGEHNGLWRRDDVFEAVLAFAEQ